MQKYKEGSLNFVFPDDWLLCRPQETSFYKRHFQSFCGGCKEMDFLGFDPNNQALWLIEVKDFRLANSSIRDISLELEIAEKVRDTLACFLAAAVNDNSVEKGSYGGFARSARKNKTIHVVLHLEQPKKISKLFPGVKLAADFETQFKCRLRSVDCHPRVTFKKDQRTFPWKIS